MSQKRIYNQPNLTMYSSRLPIRSRLDDSVPLGAEDFDVDEYVDEIIELDGTTYKLREGHIILDLQGKWLGNIEDSELLWLEDSEEFIAVHDHWASVFEPAFNRYSPELTLDPVTGVSFDKVPTPRFDRYRPELTADPLA
jgi:hypothetical protein